jgi:hypothetical protein
VLVKNLPFDSATAIANGAKPWDRTVEHVLLAAIHDTGAIANWLYVKAHSRQGAHVSKPSLLVPLFENPDDPMPKKRMTSIDDLARRLGGVGTVRYTPKELPSGN